jgi:hypothetical protein
MNGKDEIIKKRLYFEGLKQVVFQAVCPKSVDFRDAVQS